jgi:hypothetical protein
MALDDLIRKRLKTKKMSVEDSVNKVSDVIHKGPGRLAGAIYEKFKLRGKPGFGAHKASEPGGARHQALLRAGQGKNRDYGRYVAAAVKGGIRPGIVTEPMSQGDSEEMIKRDSTARIKR